MPNHTASLISQCAWCGKVKSGPATGRKLTLVHGDTHGVCEDCKAKWLAEYRKRLVKATA